MVGDAKVIINTGAIFHLAYSLDESGKITIAWIDSRNNKKNTSDYKPGLTDIYYAVVDLDGKILVPETRFTAELITWKEAKKKHLGKMICSL